MRIIDSRRNPANDLPARIEEAVGQAILDRESEIAIVGTSLLRSRSVAESASRAREGGIDHIEIVTDPHGDPEAGAAEAWKAARPDRLVMPLEETAAAAGSGGGAIRIAAELARAGTAISLTVRLEASNASVLSGMCGPIGRAMPCVDEVRPGLAGRDDGLSMEEIRRSLAGTIAALPGRPAVRLVRGCGFPACALPWRGSGKPPRLDHGGVPASGGACDRCALAARCGGVTRDRPSLIAEVRPLRSIPASVLGPLDRVPDSSPGVRVGRWNRLKQHGSLEEFLSRSEEWPPDVPVYMSRREWERVEADLSGLEATIARMPVARPYEGFQPLALAPLAPIVLATMLRCRGARVGLADLAVASRRALEDDEMEVLGDEERWVRFLEREDDRIAEGLVDRLLGLLPELRPGLLGLSAECDADLPLAMALGREARRRCGVEVVIGGRRLGRASELSAHWPGARFVFHEGEAPVVMLADAVARGRPLADVPGVGWREGDRFRQTRTVMHDLDVMPVLDVEGAPLGGYDEAYIGEGEGPILPYLFDKGCPHACAYCGDHTRRVVRLRSPELVVADLAAAAEHGVRRFFFLDHLFNAHRRHMEELVARLERARLGVVWADSVRATGLDAAMLGRLRRVGASLLCWGIDAGSRRMGRIMRKGIDLDAAARMLRESREAGISNQVNLIVGMPGERREDAEETARWVERVRPWVDRFLVARYRYYPHSMLGLHPGSYGLLSGAGGGVDVAGGPTWREHEPRIEEHLGIVREAAWGKASEA